MNYTTTKPARALTAEERAITKALKILEARVFDAADAMTSPDVVRRYLCVRLGAEEREHFGCLWMDSQHRVIACGELFSGTLTQTSVYPREVLKTALRLNAAAVILYHNHPSGMPEPSKADEHLTATLRDALRVIDVRVLDHIVVGAGRTVSFAERGLL